MFRVIFVSRFVSPPYEMDYASWTSIPSCLPLSKVSGRLHATRQAGDGDDFAMLLYRKKLRSMLKCPGSSRNHTPVFRRKWVPASHYHSNINHISAHERITLINGRPSYQSQGQWRRRQVPSKSARKKSGREAQCLERLHPVIGDQCKKLAEF